MAQGDRTKVTTYDNVGNADPVIVQSSCNEVHFYENALAATTKYKIYEPSLSATPVTKEAGTTYIFKRSATWNPGQTVGYCETVDVSAADFAQEEKENPR